MQEFDFGGVSYARVLQVVYAYRKFDESKFKASQIESRYAIPVSTGMQAGFFDGMPKAHFNEAEYKLSNKGLYLAQQAIKEIGGEL